MAFLRARSAPRHPQTVRSNAREVANHAGGFVYEVDAWPRLDRFLLLGSAGGTYYVDQAALTEANAELVRDVLAIDGPRVVARAVEISVSGRAAKQHFAIYTVALAAATADAATRRAAYDAMPAVCRTASTLFQLLSYIKGRRGWSRGLRSAVARWYGERTVDDAAFQMVKYRDRDGFTHRDALRLSHADPRLADGLDATSQRSALYRWAVGKLELPEATTLPKVVVDFMAARRAGNDVEARASFARRLPREALPTEWLAMPEVWEALLHGEDGRGMPMTAMVRNLATMSRVGLLTAESDATKKIVAELGNVERIRASRLHPVNLYLAAKTYASGRSVRGSGMWAPVGAIVDALERAFEVAFVNVASTGKRILIAVDSSGSMGSPVLGLPNVSAREISMATAFVIMRTEPNARLIGFTDGSNTAEFEVAGDERLRDLVRRFEQRVAARGTDCAIPFAWTAKHVRHPQAVVTFTDSETWAGHTKVMDGLAALRRAAGSQIKVVTAATTATPFDVVDPRDPCALGIAGFDSAVPAMIGDFLAQ